MQTYCCFRREPQPLCSMLKEIEFWDWVAVNSFTGIATSPNETVSEPMERGAAIESAYYVRPLRPKASARLCFDESASCHRSPAFSKRAGTLLMVKSVGSAASSSSQVSGIETVAPGDPHGE